MVNPGREVEEYKRTSWLLVVNARLLDNSYCTATFILRYCFGASVVLDWSEEPLVSVPAVPDASVEPASDLASVLLLSLDVVESDDVLELSDEPVVPASEPLVAASGVD